MRLLRQDLLCLRYGGTITLVTRNAEYAPAGVEDAVRAAAREGGGPVYRSMEAAAVAVAAGKSFSRKDWAWDSSTARWH